MTRETDNSLLLQFVDSYIDAVDAWQQNTKGQDFLGGMRTMQPVLQTTQVKLRALTLTTPQGEYIRCLIDAQLAGDISDIQKILDNPQANMIDGHTRATMDYYYGEHGAWPSGRSSQLKYLKDDCGNRITTGFNLTDAAAKKKLEDECKTHDMSVLEKTSMETLAAQYAAMPFARETLPTSVPPVNGSSTRVRG